MVSFTICQGPNLSYCGNLTMQRKYKVRDTLKCLVFKLQHCCVCVSLLVSSLNMCKPVCDSVSAVLYTVLTVSPRTCHSTFSTYMISMVNTVELQLRML